MANETVEVRGDGPTVRVDAGEAHRMAAALRDALADPAAVAGSGAPEPLQQALVRDYPAEPLTMADQVRVGEWLLVSTESGPRWDLRMVSPEGGRVGLLFRVPLVRDAQTGWRAASVHFVRAW